MGGVLHDGGPRRYREAVRDPVIRYDPLQFRRVSNAPPRLVGNPRTEALTSSRVSRRARRRTSPAARRPRPRYNGVGRSSRTRASPRGGHAHEDFETPCRGHRADHGGRLAGPGRSAGRRAEQGPSRPTFRRPHAGRAALPAPPGRAAGPAASAAVPTSTAAAVSSGPAGPAGGSRPTSARPAGPADRGGVPAAEQNGEGRGDPGPPARGIGGPPGGEGGHFAGGYAARRRTHGLRISTRSTPLFDGADASRDAGPCQAMSWGDAPTRPRFAPTSALRSRSRSAAASASEGAGGAAARVRRRAPPRLDRPLEGRVGGGCPADGRPAPHDGGGPGDERDDGSPVMRAAPRGSGPSLYSHLEPEPPGRPAAGHPPESPRWSPRPRKSGHTGEDKFPPRRVARMGPTPSGSARPGPPSRHRPGPRLCTTLRGQQGRPGRTPRVAPPRPASASSLCLEAERLDRLHSPGGRPPSTATTAPPSSSSGS